MNSTKTTSTLSTVLIVAGFLLIVLAWSGAASTRYVDAQLPYMISGGLTGISLVGCGCALAIIQELRKSAATVASRIDALAAASRGDAVDNPMTDTLPEPRVPAPSTIERAGAGTEIVTS